LNRIKELTEQFYEKKYTCLIADPEKIIFTSFDKGVKPLFDFYNTMKNDTNSEKELYLIDKVIGKGAAYLCILSGIKRIRTEVISKPALKILADNGIDVIYETLTEYISNMKKTGICPVESLSYEYDTPESFYPALSKFLKGKRELKGTC
jgi:hypothetical protein